MLQARTTLGLGGLAGLAFALHTRDDARAMLAAAALGILLLGLALFSDARGRVLFAVGNLAALACYSWAAGERLPVTVLVEPGRTIVRAGEGPPLVAAQGAAGSGIYVALPPGDPLEAPGDDLAGWLARAVERALTTNVASGVDRLAVRDAAGQVVLGEADWLSVSGGLAAALPAGGGLRVDFDLLNGGPRVDLLVGVDEGLRGPLVRLWPNNRGLSVHQSVGGAPVRELAGGYVSLRKPPLQGLQTILRELLRAWLVGLAVVGLGVVLARPLRGVPGPTEWRLPGSVPLGGLLLALVGLAATVWIARDVLEAIPHVQDDVAYLFQARTLALGRLSVPLPPVPEAFEHEFILMRDDQWFGKYPPGHPALLVIGVLVGAPWLVSPIAAALTLPLIVLCGRRLYGGGTGLLAGLLLLSSPFFLFMSGSTMAHATSLFLAALATWLALVSLDRDRVWPLVACGVALGWLIASRSLTGLGLSAPLLAWLAVERLRRRRSLPALGWLALGLAWPLIGLLAYNRALTGSPLLNPFELWWDFDRVGFGPQVGMHGGHDLGRALGNLKVNLDQLQVLLFGWPTYVTLAFAALPFATGRWRSGDWLCLGMALSLAGAYLYYWADGLMFGPRYLYEASGALALLTARGIVTAAEASSGVVRSLLRRRESPATGPLYALLVVGLLAGNTWLFLPGEVERHRGYNFVDGGRLRVVARAGLRSAVVFVPSTQPHYWWEYGSVFPANDPLLQGEVIYARDLGEAKNREVLAAFPGRSGYRLMGTYLEPVR